MNIVYLLIGGNLGDRLKNMAVAKNILEQKIGLIKKSSSLYETAPWGFKNQPDFLNQVLIIKSNLSADEIMHTILSIEKTMGRLRTNKNAPRIIDIDILFFNKEIINKPNLIIPHPQITNRKFVLIPLNELSPGFIHPSQNKNIKSLLSTCSDPLQVKLISNS